MRKPAASRLLAVCLALALCSLGGFAWGAAYTSAVAAGNLDDPATWSPRGVPGPADSATICAGHEITVPAGCNAQATVVFKDATAADHSRLIVNGSLTLAGNLALMNYCELVGGPGGLLDLAGKVVTTGAASKTKYVTLRLQGSPGAFFLVTSSLSGGAFTSAGTAEVDIDCSCTAIVGLAASRLGGGTVAAQGCRLSHCVVSGCGNLQLYNGAFHPASDFVVEYCDFRDVSAANGLILYPYLSSATTPPTGIRRIDHSTFASVNTAKLQIGAPGLEMTDCVRSNVKWTCYYGGANMRRSVSLTGTWTSGGVDSMPLKGSVLEGNYYYLQYANPHLIQVSVGSGLVTVKGCVFECACPTNSGDHGECVMVSPANSAACVDVTGNLLFDDGNPHGWAATLFNVISGGYHGTVNLLHNTVWTTNVLRYGLLGRTETSANVWANATVKHNLVVKRGANGGRGLNLQSVAANQLVYTDYNAWFNIAPVGVVYYHVSFDPPLVEGLDTGFGGHEAALSVDPRFADPARSLKGWDASLGGPGTVAGAAAGLLLMNGYDATGRGQNPSLIPAGYTPSALVAWVREGFSPTNPALAGAGDPADGQPAPDIGAMPVTPR
jgi:hypothetical protein